MIIVCDSCLARYRYDETRFAGRRVKKVRCTKCLSVFEVQNPAFVGGGASAVRDGAEETYVRLADETGGPKPAGFRAQAPVAAASGRPAGETLALPVGAKLSLAVIAGPAAGNDLPDREAADRHRARRTATSCSRTPRSRATTRRSRSRASA